MSDDQRNLSALKLGEFFPDEDLVEFLIGRYGYPMAFRVEALLAEDPHGERGFTRAVRRSITHEIEESHRG